MTATVFVDAAGGHTGGAGRFRVELYDYLKRSKRADIKVIGKGAGWIPPGCCGGRSVGRSMAAWSRSTT